MRDGKLGKSQIITHLSLVAASTFFMLPIIWLIWSSFKPTLELLSHPYPPKNFTYINFVNAFYMMDFTKSFINTIIITLSVVPATLIISALIAYPFAVHEFRGKTFFTIFLISGILVPSQVIFIPLFMLLKTIGLVNTLLGVILPQIANGIPLGFLVFVSFFRGVLREVIEAARIDGSSELEILVRIVIPLSKPAFIFIGIFKGVLTWSEFTIPLIVLYDRTLYPLTLSMQVFKQQYAGVYWAEMFAGLTLNILPMLVIYGLFSSKFIRGITLGAVKG